ncbi:hypothetical protein GCM10010038_10750 [Glutamicibacter protophormiae]|nr:hypothetical protein GCM10010038_10750 [Glutamicibacter protophormiae]
MRRFSSSSVTMTDGRLTAAGEIVSVIWVSWNAGGEVFAEVPVALAPIPHRTQLSAVARPMARIRRLMRIAPKK